MAQVAQDSQTAVLIVGAGPSGVVLALTLAQNGVPVRIIDKDAIFHVGQRGPGIQPRSLELFRFLGVVDDVLENSIAMPPRRTYEMPEGIKPISTDHMAGPPRAVEPAVPYPNPVIIGQCHLEEILRAQMAKYNVHVELGMEFVDFEENESGVRARVLRHGLEGDTTEFISSKWIVSAEGGKSTMRKQLGLTFLGETRDNMRLLIIDMYVQGLDPTYWHSWGDRSDRLVVIRPSEYPGLFCVTLSTFDLELDLDALMSNREALIEYIHETTHRRDLVFGEMTWQTKWRANIRMVNQFSKGSAFLVGDAAHVHTPAGGQGANTGMQDGFNLAWKLALVYKGLASPSLLDTYNEERLPVARAVLDRTTAYVSTYFNARDAAPGMFRQLGVNYRWSSAVVDDQGESKTGEEMAAYLPEETKELRAGDRAPDAPGLRSLEKHDEGSVNLFSIFKPTSHTLLLFDPAADEVHAILTALSNLPKGTFHNTVILSASSETRSFDGIDEVVVDTAGHAYAAYHPAKDGFRNFVIRPDGTLGAIVKGREGVEKYLKAVFDH